MATKLPASIEQEIVEMYQQGMKVRDIAKKVYDFIEGEVKKGKTVYLYGASTRGNSLIQVCNLNNKLITITKTIPRTKRNFLKPSLESRGRRATRDFIRSITKFK